MRKSSKCSVIYVSVEVHDPAFEGADIGEAQPACTPTAVGRLPMRIPPRGGDVVSSPPPLPQGNRQGLQQVMNWKGCISSTGAVVRDTRRRCIVQWQAVPRQKSKPPCASRDAKSVPDHLPDPAPMRIPPPPGQGESSLTCKERR